MSLSTFRLRAAASVAVAALFALSGCSNAEQGTTPAPSAEKTVEASAEAPAMSATEFPLTVDNADGSTTTIPAKPTRVVSTSVTLTGMSVPFQAPIVASATAANADFFPAWKADAEKMNVEKLWKAQVAANLEAVTAAKPDLILVSATGADSVKDQMADLQKIAPTVMIDYSKSSWQDVTKQLGKITGREDAANKVIADFNAQVKDVASKIKHPEGKVNIISYNGAAKPNAIAMTSGPYGELFTALGFDVEEPKTEWNSGNQEGGHRTDFVFTSLEHLTELTAQTTFLIHADQEVADQMLANPVLANVPSVQAKQVHPLGKKVFRLDYYSSQLVMKAIEKLYAK